MFELTALSEKRYYEQDDFTILVAKTRHSSNVPTWHVTTFKNDKHVLLQTIPVEDYWHTCTLPCHLTPIKFSTQKEKDHVFFFEGCSCFTCMMHEELIFVLLKNIFSTILNKEFPNERG